jgi:hypothetical protein
MGFEADNAIVHMAPLLRRSLANRADELQRWVTLGCVNVYSRCLVHIVSTPNISFPCYVCMNISLGRESVTGDELSVRFSKHININEMPGMDRLCAFG